MSTVLKHSKIFLITLFYKTYNKYKITKYSNRRRLIKFISYPFSAIAIVALTGFLYIYICLEVFNISAIQIYLNLNIKIDFKIKEPKYANDILIALSLMAKKS